MILFIFWKEEILESSFQEFLDEHTDHIEHRGAGLELHDSKVEPTSLSNIYHPHHYDKSGCPVVPIAYSEMTGRLGNVMSTYANFIAIQRKLGLKYFLPKYINHLKKNLTKPILQSIFKNVSFPTASLTRISLTQDAKPEDRITFSNVRTNYTETDCNKQFFRIDNILPTLTEQLACAYKNKCVGKSCLQCNGSCLCTNIWVTKAIGANFLEWSLVGDVLDEIIRDHFRFTDSILLKAKHIIQMVGKQMNEDVQTVYVGVHIRRTDFHQFSKNWLKELLNETFYESAMDYFRQRYSQVAFLVVSDDVSWCKAHLKSPDTYHVGTPSAEVDMAIMANCNASIVDYGTFGMWGAILAGGETVTSKQTFRDTLWAADYFGWTYI